MAMVRPVSSKSTPGESTESSSSRPLATPLTRKDWVPTDPIVMGVLSSLLVDWDLTLSQESPIDI